MWELGEVVGAAYLTYAPASMCACDVTFNLVSYQVCCVVCGVWCVVFCFGPRTDVPL